MTTQNHMPLNSLPNSCGISVLQPWGILSKSTFVLKLLFCLYQPVKSMLPESPDSNVPEPDKATQTEPGMPLFVQQVTPLLTDLLYPSESDEPIEPVETYLKMAGPLTVSHIKDWLMLPPSRYVEEITEAEFWEPVTAIEDWFSEEEKEKAARFQKLQKTLDILLTERQVFRVGKTEIDVYLLGKPKEGPRVGLKTRAIET